MSASVFGRLVADSARDPGPDGRPPPFTAATVGNWVRRELVTPRQVEKNPDGSVLARWFDPADAPRLASRLTDVGTGGRRPGAGRKRKARPPNRTNPPTAEAQQGSLAERMDDARTVREVMTRESPPDQPLHHEDLPRLTTEELRTLARVVGPDGPMSEAALQRFKLLVELRARQLATDRDAGRLLDAEETRRAWADELSALATHLRGLPLRLAERLQPIAAPNDDEVTQAADLLAAAGCDPDAAAKAIDLLRRPSDLAQAIAAQAEMEVGRMLGELGKS